MVRAKFKCRNIHDDSYIPRQGIHVTFEAVTNETEENKVWSKWTPSGTLMMYITNPGLFDTFELNKEYYLDIKEA